LIPRHKYTRGYPYRIFRFIDYPDVRTGGINVFFDLHDVVKTINVDREERKATRGRRSSESTREGGKEEKYE